MEKDKIIDALIVLVIALVGLFTAYLTFGILKSQAQGEFHSYQVGGAIAGALVSWSLLASVYLQVRKSSNELEKLHERIQELQQKVIRGTPHPSGFEIEVSEQMKIVLARPEGWARRGGVIFDFELAEPPRGQNDYYPARFTCSFVPIKKEYKERGRDQFYEIFLNNIKKNEFNYHPTSEYISIGGELESPKSLKVIARQYMRIEYHENAYGGKERLQPLKITEEEYENKKVLAPSATSSASPERSDATTVQDVPVASQTAKKPRVVFAKITHMFVACYREDLGNIFFFEFIDDEDDFVKSSENFNKVLESTRFLT
jgi:hypothetical protein